MLCPDARAARWNACRRCEWCADAMTLRLADLSACFDGVIPSIIATAAADGTPNVSYLSHVVRVDDDHVALSNQFFAKTAANIRANPLVTLILVDCFTGEEYLLDVRFVRSLDSGPLFEGIARHLAASSAQIGMANVMKLKSADMFRVEAIGMIPSPLVPTRSETGKPIIGLTALAAAVRSIERQEDMGAVIEQLLQNVRRLLDCRHAQILAPDTTGGSLITIGSLGYDNSGIGSEVASNEGLIGLAVSSGKIAKVSDMSRFRRFGDAIKATDGGDEDRSRNITRPSFDGARSQIAIPLLTNNEVVAVLLTESERPAAFGADEEAALEMLAASAARAMRGAESLAASARQEPAPDHAVATPCATDSDVIRVVHHRFDDSVFVDDAYVVKGIAGAILRQMLEWHRDQRRIDFSNRELRLALAARMPDFKDNLETRLLLLRRRLDEKETPLRLAKTGRGQLRLLVPDLASVEMRHD
ncbi:GAF domain-containing protein [Sphingobium sp. LB126]|uniref:GAF domain-containing protein n=1 Tax=Sphingobium sp. LB126 TaxID=1983755 RepID=UPI001F5BF803|nr:GAF domain-containing protein [Sphingobium sp. LB126]